MRANLPTQPIARRLARLAATVVLAGGLGGVAGCSDDGAGVRELEPGCSESGSGSGSDTSSGSGSESGSGSGSDTSSGSGSESGTDSGSESGSSSQECASEGSSST